jgi:hypothetical protein
MDKFGLKDGDDAWKDAYKKLWKEMKNLEFPGTYKTESEKSEDIELFD